MPEHSLGKVDARGAEDCPYSLFTVTSETQESAESTVEKRRKGSSFRSHPEVDSREELCLSLDCDGAEEKPSCDDPPSVEERFGNAEIATHARNGALF